ncbi:type II secretion system minor pseudopilin GspK [Lacisediminimonas sp.]|uniref:type II secretion system minor pseudopilin GspK n=1 Tax=Lacisediminimonas sp. TaxID=3060582 RepID=UPI00271E58EC|nr:type II secretion system minor pseudopilin GspK [Lacisediminimonas sp.]MDO8301227.1 type II secretion system minor pseudopilin GspK [Lacisediminimonas sp.]
MRRPGLQFIVGRAERGVAVVTALLLTTLAVTIVAGLFWQQQVQVRSIENQRLQLQKQWILRGALDWARLILREDAKFSTIDALDEPWAVPLSETRLDQYVENGRAQGDAADAALSGGIIDAQARFNLTNIAPNGAIDAAEVLAFSRLLASQRIEPGLAQKTADLMRATAPLASATPGQPAALAQQMPLTQVDDLLAVDGFTSEQVERLRPFVVVLPRATPVNANTAPAEVLSAKVSKLTPGDAAALVNARQTAHFRDLADVTQRLAGSNAGVPANALSVSTNFFIVNGRVRMARASLDVEALIERTGPRTNVIWVREH